MRLLFMADDDPEQLVVSPSTDLILSGVVTLKPLQIYFKNVKTRNKLCKTKLQKLQYQTTR